jgi:hypothetical protein
VSFAETLVLVAVYGLTSLLLSILIAFTWHAGLNRRRMTSGDLLALRLLPSGGALFLALTTVLPAFVIYEPAQEAEKVGPLRACATTAALVSRCGPADRSCATADHRIDIVDIR